MLVAAKRENFSVLGQNHRVLQTTGDLRDQACSAAKLQPHGGQAADLRPVWVRLSRGSVLGRLVGSRFGPHRPQVALHPASGGDAVCSHVGPSCAI